MCVSGFYFPHVQFFGWGGMEVPAITPPANFPLNIIFFTRTRSEVLCIEKKEKPSHLMEYIEKTHEALSMPIKNYRSWKNMHCWQLLKENGNGFLRTTQNNNITISLLLIIFTLIILPTLSLSKEKTGSQRQSNIYRNIVTVSNVSSAEQKIAILFHFKLRKI